jgi:hypothetical protein
MNDKRHGNGRFIWSDGDSYEGTWFNGRRLGFGKLITKNGIFIQNWREDLKFDVLNKGPLDSPKKRAYIDNTENTEIAKKQKSDFRDFSVLRCKTPTELG